MKTLNTSNHEHRRLKQKLWAKEAIVFSFCLLFSFFSKAQYEWRSISPIPTGNTINSVAYPTPNRTIAVGNAGTLLVSESGPLNWDTFNNPSTFGYNTIVDVDFADANNGYILIRGGDQVMKTTTGGEAGWIVANGNGAGVSGGNNTTVGKEIQVIDANTVVTINSVRAYITLDGGDIWTEITPTGLGSSPQFEDIFFLDASTGYLLTRGNGLFKTTDGGTNWTQLTAFTGIQGSIVYFENENNGWVVEGTNNSITNTIHRTTDGGATWSSQDYSGGFLTAKELIFTSSTEGKLFDNNNVFTTNDAGVTWTLEATLPMTPLGISYNEIAGQFLLGGADGSLGLYENGSFVSISNSLTNGKTIVDLHFNDLNNGFVVTTDDVFRTADAGISWISLDQENINDIEFATSQIGYLIGVTKTIQKTTNGGLTWSEVTPLDAGSYIPQSSNFIDANTGWVVGSNSTVFKTTDGGNSWSSQTVPVGSLTLYDVFFLDANTGYISASGGYVFKTVDGGSNWTDANFPETDNVFEMYWSDANTGYLATRKIWKTTDGGANWSSDGFSPTGTVSDIQFLDANTGFATFQGGVIYQTTDAGGTWNIFTEGGEISQNLSELFVIDVDNIWAASAKSLFNRSFINLSTPTAIGVFLPSLDFCPGEEFIASFTSNGQFPDEDVTLQLSDEFGSFASPVAIGILSEVSTHSGNIEAAIPAMVTPSTGYRIRAVSPSVTGSDNGYDLAVGGPPSPTSFVTSTAEVCKGSISIPYEIEPVEGMSYLWSYSGGGSFSIIGNGTPSITVSFFNSATSGTLSVVLSNACGESDPLELEITVGTPDSGGTAEGGTTVCAGTQAPDLSVSGHVGEVIRWEQSVSPFSSYTPISNSNNATFTPPGTITETTRFRAVVQDTGCGEAFSSYTIVNVAQPSIGGNVIALSGNTEISSGTSPGNLSLSGHLGNVLRWEKSVAPFIDYAPISNTSTLYNPGSLTEDTRFRAVVQNSVCQEATSDFLEITILDEALPQVVSLSPTNNSNDVSINSNFIVTFNEPIQKGTGSILLKRVSDDVSVFGVSINSSEVVLNDTQLSFTPLNGNISLHNTQYYIEMNVGAIQDLAGNNFGGFAGNDWTFATEDLTPYINQFSPESGSTNVPLDQVFTIEYSRPIIKGTGAINFNDPNTGVAQLSINVLSDEVLISDNVVTIDPVNDLPAGSELTISIVAAAFTDENGVYAEPFENGDWVFTTAKLNQSITFDPINDKVYGDGSLMLNASASSGLDVSFSVVSGPVTLNNKELTITGAGTAVIAANQAGNETFNPAPEVQQSFVISKADQVITIEPIADKLTSDEPFDVIAAVDSNLELTYAIDGPATISGTTITLDGNAGTVTVTVSQAGNQNYNPASENISFEVTEQAKQNQTISFDAITDKVYGDGSFMLNATASSGLDVSFSVVSGPVTLNNNELTITGAGTAVIAANQAGNETFNPAPEVQQSFVISKADQIITIEPIADKLTSDEPFDVIASVDSNLELTYAIDGPATIIGTTITLTGEVGTVTVTVSQAGNENYNPTSKSVTFNVNEESALNVGDEINIKLYPNPAVNHLNIEGKDELKVKLFNLKGQLIHSKSGRNIKLDVSDLPQGIYLVEILNNHTRYQRKIMKAN